MKKLIAILLIITSFTALNAGIVYTDIADVTLPTSGSIDIDFNGDAGAEFTITDDGYGGTIMPSVMFTSASYHFATVSATEWDVIKGLALNSPINTASGWHDLGDAYVDPGWQTTNFPTNNDTYIGAQFLIGTSSHFGWIRVNWDGSGTFIIKDYAYESTPNTAINAGDVSMGLSEITTSNISIFPNPTKDFISFIGLSNNIKAISIFSANGKLMHSQLYLNNDIKVDVRKWSAGVYYIRIDMINGRKSSLKFLKY